MSGGRGADGFEPAYDPDARRDTPLAAKLKAQLRSGGQLLTVGDYMRACLNDPDHGYYVTQSAIGRDGDFITAPEISQIFGELIGLWCVAVWQQMGAPASFRLIEYGPGRGTLMADALRAARVVPSFLAAAQVRLVDTSRQLQQRQAAALQPFADALQDLAFVEPLSDAHYSACAEAEGVPALVIGNEFLDVAPAEQFVKSGAGWFRRYVGLDENGALTFCGPRTHEGLGPPKPRPMRDLDELFPTTADGGCVTVPRYNVPVEMRPGPTVGLFIDYGHTEPHPGDTLQAVRQHAYEHPLTSPGEADLTAQVDFSLATACFKQDRLSVDGPITQAEFLGRLGSVERASKLMAANPDKAAAIEAGVARLMAVPGMGDRFKVLGVRSKEVPPLPGF